MLFSWAKVGMRGRADKAIIPPVNAIMLIHIEHEVEWVKEVTVCVGSSCHLKGSYQVVKTFESLIKEYALQEKLKLKASFCQGQCQGGIAVTFDGEYLPNVTMLNCKQVFLDTILPQLDN